MFRSSLVPCFINIINFALIIDGCRVEIGPNISLRTSDSLSLYFRGWEWNVKFLEYITNYYKKHFDLRIKVQIESTSSSQVIRLFKNQSSIKSTSLLPVKRWFNVIPGVVLVFSSIWKVNERTPYQAFLSGKGKVFQGSSS